MFRKSILGLGMLLLPIALLASNPGNPPGNDSKEDIPHNSETSTSVAVQPSLNLSADNNAVTVRWQTMPNQESSLYSVLRSEDGDNWKPVFSLKCSNKAATGRVHAIYDRNLEPGDYQYRVRSVDLDGTIVYSETATIGVNDSFANPAPAMTPASNDTFGSR